MIWTTCMIDEKPKNQKKKAGPEIRPFFGHLARVKSLWPIFWAQNWDPRLRTLGPVRVGWTMQVEGSPKTIGPIRVTEHLNHDSGGHLAFSCLVLF